jgi:hypothetical protein
MLHTIASVKEVLTHLNLLHEGELTNAAVLLFVKAPHKIFLQAEVNRNLSYWILSGRMLHVLQSPWVSVCFKKRIYQCAIRKSLIC